MKPEDELERTESVAVTMSQRGGSSQGRNSEFSLGGMVLYDNGVKNAISHLLLLN